MAKTPDKKKAPPGPKAKLLKINVGWEEAVKKAVGRKRPARGWPTPQNQLRKERPKCRKVIEKLCADRGMKLTQFYEHFLKHPHTLGGGLPIQLRKMIAEQSN